MQSCMVRRKTFDLQGSYSVEVSLPDLAEGWLIHVYKILDWGYCVVFPTVLSQSTVQEYKIPKKPPTLLFWILIDITYAYVYSLRWFVETFVDVCSAPNNQLSVSKNNRFTLIRKKIKFASYRRKFRRERLQSHIWLTASSNMTKYLRISSNMTLQLLPSEFPYIWGKFIFLFYQCINFIQKGCWL